MSNEEHHGPSEHHTCELSHHEGCRQPVITGENSGDKFVINKQLTIGNLIVLVSLTVGLISSWVRMQDGLSHIESMVQANKLAITDNRLAQKDLLNTIVESNRIIGARVDRLLELELQSRR